MDRWVGRVALVTGASVGIGAAVVRALVKHGLKVVGCARNLDKLEALSLELSGPGSFHPIRCDVSNDDDVTRLFSTVETEYGGVDVCVNNAGLAYSTPLLSAATEHMRHMLEVNVLALSVCTREAVKSMRERNVPGHVINIASTAAHQQSPNSDVHFYSATKHAVRALTEGVRLELNKLKLNIRITEISPGSVSTEFVEKMMRNKDETERAIVRPTTQLLQPEDIADAVVYALSAPPHVQVNEIIMRPLDVQT